MPRFLFALLFFLAPTAWAANWNQLTDNIFIPRAFKVASDSSYLSVQDTTLALSAKRVLLGSLLLDQWNCVNPAFSGASYRCDGSFSKFREREKLTALHNASRSDTLNVWPALWQAQITTAGDSLVLLDRTAGRIWWTLKSAAANACSSGTFNDVAIMDGIIRLATSKGECDLDFLTDAAYINTTAGVWKYRGNLQQRNDGLHQDLLSSSPAIVNNTVNAVSVTRNPFGQTDALGRLLPFWGIGTLTRSSYYNPIANTLNDLSGGNNSRNSMVITSRGSIYETVDMASGTFDSLGVTYSIFKYTADNNGADKYISGGGFGASKLAWANTSTLPRVAVVERGSVAGNQGDIAVLGSDLGAYFVHYFPGVSAAKSDTAGAKIRLTNTYIGAPEFGDCVLAAAGDNTTDASPYGNTLTVVGSPGFKSPSSTVVFSGAYSSTNGSYLRRFDSDFQTTALQPASMMCAFKSASATNPAAINELLMMAANAGLTSEFRLTLNATTGFPVVTRSASSQTDAVTGALDVYDAKWHTIIGNFTGASLDLYIDGQLIGTDTSIAATAANISDSLLVGSYPGSVANHFNGLISGWSYDKVALTPKEAQWYHQRMVASLQVEPGGRHLHALDVDYVQSYGSNIIMGNQDSAIVWDGILGLPIPNRRYGSPGGNIQDASIISDGADSLTIGIGTTTKTQVIAPDPRLIDLAQRGPVVQPAVGEPVIADSTGRTGIFWLDADAIPAAVNANKIGFLHSQNGDFLPIANNATNIGSATYTPDSLFIHVAAVVGDIPYLDNRDDVAEIMAIQGSGIFDAKGREIVDDNTLPKAIVLTYDKDTEEQIITPIKRTTIDKITTMEGGTKDTTFKTEVIGMDTSVVLHKMGDVKLGGSGKPFVDMSAAIGQLQGAIRQLAVKNDSLRERLDKIEGR